MGSDFQDKTATQCADLKQAFKDRRMVEADRFRAATDSEYWFAVCFPTRAEKDAFLKAAGLWEHGDKYLDGRVVADTLGINLEE